MLEAERRFLRSHRPQVLLDVLTGRDRNGPEIDRSLNERAGALGRTVRTLVERLEIRRVERVVVLEPFLTAERALRQLQLEDVVENAPGRVGLPEAVAVYVVCESGPRRELVFESERDRIGSDARRGRVRRNFFVFRPQAGVDRQLVAHGPTVLDEQ